MITEEMLGRIEQQLRKHGTGEVTPADMVAVILAGELSKMVVNMELMNETLLKLVMPFENLKVQQEVKH